ncbi:DoxX family protein [Cucumibacter marinus]|uniref:DoxX family protein n=1 Tax=Cucumibacter marinus TaxID=1121252 RepID=UPI0003F60F10|nr:DoxX family protein [Cucumibacter marinus]
MDTITKAAPLVARILLALMFVLAGVAKLMDPASNAGYFEFLGLPAPGILVYVVGLFELIGGLALIAGFQARIAAIALAVFSIAAALLAHNNFADQMQMTMFLKNLAVAGGLLLVTANGAGAFALDKRASA